MGDFGKCPTCHEWNWMTNHVCPPRWYVTILDEYYHDQEEHPVYARDASSAAEKFAYAWDMEDLEGYFLEGEIEVMVRLAGRPGASEKYVYTITGEMVPEYNAREKEMPHE